MPVTPRRGGGAALHADPTPWLLEPDNPSVRYLALRDLLDRPAKDRELQEARRQIMRSGAVPAILAQQAQEGAWEKPERFYTAKYTGTAWQLIILAELMADGTDPRIRQACHLILDLSQDRESHGFSVHHAARSGGGRHSEVIPCLTGNLVFALLRLGCGARPEVQQAVRWMATYQRFDDGIADAPQGWPYDRWEMCWGRHTCHMGVVKALKALAEIPVRARPPAVRRCIANGVEFLLVHHVYKRSHDLARVSKPGWQRFGFPLMYQTDVLEILLILTQLGCRDARMQEAVDLLRSRQDAAGRWCLANPPPGRCWVDIEPKGQPSKWVTLRALTVLKRLRGSSLTAGPPHPRAGGQRGLQQPHARTT
ncbi:MAG: nitrogen fixation protein NifH [Deltaproteobacteria bacterium]|nr:nitrogen fixation protein NifH [Deltaproteobacteria bacterium]